MLRPEVVETHQVGTMHQQVAILGVELVPPADPVATAMVDWS